MFKAVSNVFIIAVMLVAFIGQAFAFNTSISSENILESTSVAFSESVTGITSNTVHSDDCCGMECCDVECTCIVNACSLFVYFNTDAETTTIVVLSEAVHHKHSAQPQSISTSRYRPPIFIS